MWFIPKSVLLAVTLLMIAAWAYFGMGGFIIIVILAFILLQF